MPRDKLVVRTTFGDITVRSDADATEVHAEATLIGRGSTPSEADKALSQIQATLSPKHDNSDVVTARGKHPKNGLTRSYAVEWYITAPPDVVIEAHTGFGDVDVGRFNRGVTISTAFGEIEAEAAGPIDLASAFGDIELKLGAENPDDVKVATEFGDVDVRLPMNRAGRVLADTDFGSVDAHFGAVPIRLLRARDHHFDAELAGAGSPIIDLVTQFGDVDIRAYKAE